MDNKYLTAVAERRSYYGISKETVVSDERIQEIVEQAILHTPSAFNSQSTRMVLLLEKEHDRLWDITLEILRTIVPEENFAGTEEKITSFKNGYGTVLYFEDQDVVKGLMEAYPLYADNFPVWSQQTCGMHQLVVWTALEQEGLGASLQHYSQLIREAVAKEWNLPSNWNLDAQMPFGKPVLQPDAKQFQPIESRLKIFK